MTLFDELLTANIYHRVGLEVGFGTGYVVAAYLGRGFTSVIALDTPGNGTTVMNTFEPDPRVVLYEGYGEHFKLHHMLDARVTTVTCIVGDSSLTEHVADLFLSSPYACELAFLLPHRDCDAEKMLRDSGAVDIRARLAVRLARSSGTRTVVVAVKKRPPKGKNKIRCSCTRHEPDI